MMWNNKLALLVLLVFVTSACSKSDDPPLLTSNVGGEGYVSNRTTIAQLKEMYTGTPTVIEGDVFIEGKKIGSNRGGNFYKILIVQDETGGIPIRIDMEDVSSVYYHGSTIRVYCNSLVLDNYGGSLELGIAGSDNHIPERLFSSVFKQITTGGEYVQPKILTLDNITSRFVNCWVRYENVQFTDEHKNKLWVDPNLEYTDRHLIDMKGRTAIVRSSKYSTYNLRLTPTKSGYITGVLNYYNGDYYLTVFDAYSAVMEEQRFVPTQD